MPRIALATSSKHPNLAPDDRLLLPPLAERGIEAEPAIWDDPARDWSSFDAVLLRSCWDYHLKAEAFLRWIARLEQSRIPVWNSASRIRWNANKSYLRDLDAKGIPIVPTFWPEAGEEVGLRERLRDLGWTKAVVKPRISATAHRTHLIAADQADSVQSLFDDLRRRPGVMLQKFMDSIVKEGEWSLIFFGDEFSHAVRKTPKAGDFRVQNDFGGSEQPADPPSQVLHAATRIIHTVAPTLYARVDGVVDDEQFRLMELELIEPMLFLASHPAAPTRFANTLAAATPSR
jgi:glutathione synthase/RimK-type ligase-like ATP-grasp enzyme